MNKEDIKKALGICAELCPELCKRFDCPYYTQNCTDDILKDALDLIVEQEKEIEQLKAKNKVLGDGVVKAFTNGFTDGRKEVEKDIRRAKINVLNELKEKCKFDGHTVAVYKNDIDKMIEELKK